MKLYLGRRLRNLRRELGLNQSAMAAEINVSPSYLNHLERNQRPVTAQVLLKLAEVYDVDLKSFAAEGGEGTGASQLAEIFADPMFGGLAVPRYEAVEVADNAPAVADAISRLYAALVELRRQPATGEAEGDPAALRPQNWGRDGGSQHYDLHRKRLMLSALLRPESRTFALAYQLALVEFRPLLERMVE